MTGSKGSTRAPRVACVVTCHNLGAYLRETLASIEAQTYGELEVCVVDDGSTDAETLAVLQALEGGGTRVVRSDRRGGLPAARNRGVTETSGEYICAVDADDVLAPTLIERSVACLDANPELSFVSHWLRAFGDQVWEWSPLRCDFPALLQDNTVNGAALVRRSAVLSIGGWDETFRDGCEDWDFWITLVERGAKGHIIPEVLFHYRRRPDSMSRASFSDDGLARLYRRLVEKHDATFRRYLPELLAAREVATRAGRRAADELDEDLQLRLRPSLAGRRDARATAEQRRHEAAEERRRGEERAALQSALERRDADYHRAAAEVQALRSSWSWRLTAPLRAAGAVAVRALRAPRP